MIKEILVKDENLMIDRLKCYKLNLLYGCNGIGKTTILQHIIDKTAEFKMDNAAINIFKYSNSRDNDRYQNPTPFDPLYTEKIANLGLSQYKSEGENILNSFCKWLRKNNFDKGDVLLIDEIDSGLSVEHINIICHEIIDLMNKGVQIFCAINNYHWVYVFKNYVDMSTGELVSCETYDDFFKNTAKIREKKYQYEYIRVDK